jgi:hypothetical protein
MRWSSRSELPGRFRYRGICTFFAVITEPEKVRNDPGQPSVVRHLAEIGRSPPGLDQSFV